MCEIAELLIPVQMGDIDGLVHRMRATTASTADCGPHRRCQRIDEVADLAFVELRPSIIKFSPAITQSIMSTVGLNVISFNGKAHRASDFLAPTTAVRDTSRYRPAIDVIAKLIAHRFSALHSADVIHVMDEDRVVESGSWSDLDHPGTRFRALKDLQQMTPAAAAVAGAGAG